MNAKLKTIFIESGLMESKDDESIMNFMQSVTELILETVYDEVQYELGHWKADDICDTIKTNLGLKCT